MAAESLKCRECAEVYPLDARYVCERCFGPLEVAYRPAADRRRRRRAPPHPGRAPEHLALRRLPAARGAARAVDARLVALRPARRLHAADQRRPAGRAARPRRGVGQERRRQPDALVQGPRRLGRQRPRPRARLRGARLRVDRQPRQRRRRPGRRARASSPTSSSRPTSRSRRSSRRASTGRTSSRSAATTTTSTASAPSSRARRRGGRSSTSTCAPTTPRAPRRSPTRSPSSSAGRCPTAIVAPIASGSLFTKIAKGFGEWLDLGLATRRAARR